MSCNAGYPLKPCPFGFEGRVTRKTCGACKHYKPPEHILQWCMLWDREQVLCMRPIADCDTCPEKFTGQKVPDSKIDWKDPVAVRKFFREHYDPSAAKEKMDRFLAKQPNYFKDYQERNRDKVNAAARRWYHKNKAAKDAAAQQSGSKVPGDPS